MRIRLALLALLTSNSAISLDEPSSEIETIVVTLERTYGSEFDAPLSSVVLAEVDTQYSQYRDLDDLHNYVPNLRSIPHPNNSGTLLLFMRGVGNIDEQMLQDPSVAVYADGVPLPRSQGLNTELLDIQRIEVGLGPQGTLYGRNATGGSINIVSQAPNTSKHAFSHKLSMGHDALLRTQTQINYAFTENFATKISYLDTQTEGQIVNTGAGVARFGERNRHGYRIDNLFIVMNDFQVRLIFENTNSGDTPDFVGAVDFSSHILPRPSSASSGNYVVRQNWVDTTAQTLLVDWDVTDNTVFKSITSRRTLDDFQNQKFLNWAAEAIGTHEQKSQELQLFSYSQDNYFSATMGWFWFNEQATRSAANVFFDRNEIRRVFGRDIENTAKAAYAQISWFTPLLSRNLEVRIGGRQSWDDRFSYLDRALEKDGRLMFRPIPDIGEREFKNFSPSYGLSYYPNNNLHIYLNRNYGYKSGGFNARASSPERFREGFDDETLVSNEIGLKTILLDGDANFNIAYFDADYRDIQLNVQSNPLDPSASDVLNAGEASVQGLELQTQIKFSDRLQLGVNYAYLDTQYDAIFDANGQNIAHQYEFVGSPEHTLQLSVAGELVPTANQSLNYRLNWSWQDDYFTVKSANADQFTVPAYAIMSGSITWLPPLRFTPGKLSLSLWGRNLFDEDYYTNRFNGTVGRVEPAATWGAGRTFGVSISVDF